MPTTDNSETAPSGAQTSAVPPAMARRIRRRKFAQFWVFAGAAGSVLFAALTVIAPIVGYYAQWLSADAMSTIAYRIWPFYCLIEIVVQIIPMNVRQQTQGWDVVADQWTSYTPVGGVAIVITAMIFGGFWLDTPGYVMLGESFLVGMVEFQLLALGNKLIAAARGSEETPV